MVDIDVGKISESLNDKADRDLNNTQPLARTVVEVSDPSLMPSWYRVYSDGWCEQGGITSQSTSGWVNFLKAYTNLNYQVLLTTITVQADFTNNPTIDTKENNRFFFNTYMGENKHNWQASGYIK